jgi:WD40 repeat protein
LTSGHVSLKGHTGWVYSVEFSPDGKRIASGSDDTTVKVWDAATGQEIFTLKGDLGPVKSVAFSRDGKRIASVGYRRVWDAATAIRQRRAVPSQSYNSIVKVWDAATGQEILTFTGHTESVSSLAFSPDGKRIASASADKTVKVWDAATGRETLTLKGQTDWVSSVAFSPDGKRIASGIIDDTVKVWDATTGQETLTVKGKRSVEPYPARGVMTGSTPPDFHSA